MIIRLSLLTSILLAVSLAGALGLQQETIAEDREPIQLFNGKDLTGWEGDPSLWSVKDGAIVGQTSAGNPVKENTFLIWTGGVLRDFELRLLFRLHNHNSGVQYRSRDLGLDGGRRQNWTVAGYQADMDGANQYTGILYEERGRGILALVGEKVTITESGEKTVTGQTTDPATVKAAIKTDDWNEYLIVCRANHIVQRINGLVTVDVTDEDSARRSAEGILALQLHQGPPMKVEFKDITLRTLGP
jgi:hypothetical protein